LLNLWVNLADKRLSVEPPDWEWDDGLLCQTADAAGILVPANW
jgi:hypothetical protein